MLAVGLDLPLDRADGAPSAIEFGAILLDFRAQILGCLTGRLARLRGRFQLGFSGVLLVFGLDLRGLQGLESRALLEARALRRGGASPDAVAVPAP